jgi:hypothetical protein
LIATLRNIPSAHRHEAFAVALKEIAEEERGALLKSKFDKLPTDDMERLLGEEARS